MSIKSDNILINNILYTPTWQDVLYNQLWQCLIDNNVIKTLTDKGQKQDQYGENSNCSYEELFFWSSLIDYFILLKDSALKTNPLTQTEVDDIIEGFNLSCFKEIARCRYNKINIFNALVSIVEVVISDGLDFLIFDPSLSTIGNEMVVNGNFASSSNWSELGGGHTWIITSGVAFHPSGSGAVLAQSIGIQVNKFYLVSFDITFFSVGAIADVALGNHGSTATITVTGVGSYSQIVTTDSGITSDAVAIYGAGTGQVTIDNVSVKEIIYTPITSNGNDLIIQ